MGGAVAAAPQPEADAAAPPRVASPVSAGKIQLLQLFGRWVPKAEGTYLSTTEGEKVCDCKIVLERSAGVEIRK